MHLRFRNVNEAFRELVNLFHTGGTLIVKQSSRNGKVLRIDEPVTITYEQPRERVLFNAARDANPFFHLYEALWMLAGRNDVAPLAYYCSRMREFSDDGRALNGAYGYRWRPMGFVDDGDFGKKGRWHHHGHPGSVRKGGDQLNIIVNHLKADPDSRRAVLQMWNVEDDLLKIGPRNLENPADDGDQPFSKDVCCNLSVMFSLREVSARGQAVQRLPFKADAPGLMVGRVLDIAVTNRSNDLIWGLLGANYVHFTILQEYMAARLGAEVGLYHHFSNNLHVYGWNWEPETWLKSHQDYGFHIGAGAKPEYSFPAESYSFIRLVKDPKTFERELPEFVERHSKDAFAGDYSEPFLHTVAQPMCLAYHHHKRKDYSAVLQLTDKIAADDWRLAARSWVERRAAKREAAGVNG